MASKAHEHIQKASGPVATVYRCKLCGHVEKFPKATRGRAWRGYGLHHGAKCYNAMIQHFHEKHPEVFQ